MSGKVNNNKEEGKYWAICRRCKVTEHYHDNSTINLGERYGGRGYDNRKCESPEDRSTVLLVMGWVLRRRFYCVGWVLLQKLIRGQHHRAWRQVGNLSHTAPSCALHSITITGEYCLGGGSRRVKKTAIALS